MTKHIIPIALNHLLKNQNYCNFKNLRIQLEL